jgi:ABC-2 type transport system permease protein
MELAKRNFKEMWRDPLSLGIAIALPIALLPILQALGGEDVVALTPTFLAPGVALFGFVMLMFSAAMVLSRDRETALLARLFTAPLSPSDFVWAYSLPYLLVAAIQVIVLFALGGMLGLEMAGSVALVGLVLLLMAVMYVGLGMILGSLLTLNQVAAGYTVVLLLTIFAGTWFDLEEIGGVFKSFAEVFPVIHALDACRDVMFDGAGLGDIAGDLLWVLAYTIAVVVLAAVVFRRKMTE